jgi:hypothetical protein
MAKRSKRRERPSAPEPKPTLRSAGTKPTAPRKFNTILLVQVSLIALAAFLIYWPLLGVLGVALALWFYGPQLRRFWLSHGTLLLKALVIATAGLWIYGPVLHGSWLWDDDYLLQKNDLIHDPDGLWNIWFSPTTLIDYFPITVSLEWLEWQIWPDDPFCYHLTNVILHVGSALLIWYLFSKLGLRLAWLGGLFFAIHPVMVESVAWMAEIKNTLSMPPFLLALCAWIDYDRREKSEHYYLALALFFFAMLCKTTMVMFPVLILVYAWWKHGRITWRDVWRTTPFFAISLAVSVTLILLLRHGVGEETIPLGGLLSRLACAGTSMLFYFSRCFLPVLLLPIYPQWKVNPPELWQFTPWLILGVAIYGLWTRRQCWARDVLFGFGFFVINLAPFVGFRAISFMRFAWVMDHFLYLPIIGLLGLFVAVLGQVETRLSTGPRRYVKGGVAIVAIVFAVGSHQYAKTFISSRTQWTYTIQRFPNAWPAHNNLGNAFSDAGLLADAGEQYKEALRINPGYPEAHNNLGIVLAKTGHVPEAVAEFQEALRLCPELESAQDNLQAVQTWRNREPSPK